MTFEEIISKLKKRESLDPSEMTAGMEALVSGKLEDSRIEEFLVLLKEKGETAPEITAAALVMRAHAVRLPKQFTDLLDTCGTGADASHSVNVSTLVAIVAAGAGIRVAKHGNRSVSGVCGSADLLEMLGVKIDLSPEKIQRCLEKTGFAFFFAPQFHPATRFAMPARKKIKGKTIFNLLGPLSNPAGARFQLTGVYEKRLILLFTEVMRGLGVQRALAVCGSDGMDEITTCGETFVSELSGSNINAYTIHPKDFGIPTATAADLKCGSKEAALDSALRILKGEPGPKADIVALNAAAAIYIVGKAKDLKEGLALSRKILAGKKAQNKMEEIISFTRSGEILKK